MRCVNCNLRLTLLEVQLLTTPCPLCHSCLHHWLGIKKAVEFGLFSEYREFVWDPQTRTPHWEEVKY